MGTNYYAVSEKCAHCGRGEEDLHIGKSSAGWVFALRTHPDLGINTIADWLAYLNGRKIRDEYGRDTSFGDLITTIANRQGKKPAPNSEPGWFTSSGAIPGPAGLARSRDARHGEGTWDYHEREFS